MLRFCRFLYALCILYVFYGTVFRFPFLSDPVSSAVPSSQQLLLLVLKNKPSYYLLCLNQIYTVNLPGFPANLQSIQLYYLS